MADPRWVFDRTVNRYRDESTGRFLAKKTVTSLRDRVLDTASKEARTLAEQAAKGTITPETFRAGMRELLRNVHGSEAIFGRGGVHAMTPADWGRLGQTLKGEYAYLEGFVADIATLSPEQAMARAQLYMGAAVQSYEKGVAASFGIEDSLPVYPGDGSTRCLGNCRCSWVHVRGGDTIESTWQTEQDGNVCPDCAANGRKYAPLITAIPTEPVDATPVTLALSDRRAAA